MYMNGYAVRRPPRIGLSASDQKGDDFRRNPAAQSGALLVGTIERGLGLSLEWLGAEPDALVGVDKATRCFSLAGRHDQRFAPSSQAPRPRSKNPNYFWLSTWKITVS